MWKFGDGKSSTEQNPVHDYTYRGYYEVNLIVGNDFGLDSIKKRILISGKLVEEDCIPMTESHSMYYGITNVSLNTLNNTTLGATEGYEDFTCRQIHLLKKGTTYAFNIKTIDIDNYVKAWIDYNNDGIFTQNEEIAHFDSGYDHYESSVTTPLSRVVTNRPLRLRVASDYKKIYTPCQNLTLGQAEDYAVMFLDSTWIDTIATPIEAINVYPNPFKDEFFIELPQDEFQNGFEIQISNVLGQMVYQKTYPASTERNFVIPAMFSRGLYQFTIRSEDSFYVKKIVSHNGQ